MSFWNSAIGAMIGFTLGGPIGALLGGVIGSRFGSKGKRSSFSSNQQHQVAFFTALFACLAKLAKADGRVSKEEVQAVDRFIKERFKFDTDQRKFAIEIFNHAKEDHNTYEDYAYQLSSLLKNNKNALLVFYEFSPKLFPNFSWLSVYSLFFVLNLNCQSSGSVVLQASG